MRFETRTGFLFISIRNFRQLHPWTRNLLMTDHDAHTCDVCFSIWRPREYKDKRSLPLKHLHPRPCGSGISNSKTDTLWMTMDLWAQLPGYAGSVPSRRDKKESWIQQKCSLLSWQKESCVVPRCTCASERPCALRCFVPENLGRVGGNENAYFACEKMKKQIADKLFKVESSRGVHFAKKQRHRDTWKTSRKRNAAPGISSHRIFATQELLTFEPLHVAGSLELPSNSSKKRSFLRQAKEIWKRLNCYLTLSEIFETLELLSRSRYAFAGVNLRLSKSDKCVVVNWNTEMNQMILDHLRVKYGS